MVRLLEPALPPLGAGQYPKGNGTTVVAGTFATDVAATAAVTAVTPQAERHLVVRNASGPVSVPGMVNIYAYSGGATIGDGSTDATAALNAALAASPCVFLPQGRYRVGALTALTRTSTLIGEAPVALTAQAPYGDPTHSNPTYYGNLGTIIECTATSGTLFNVTTAPTGSTLHLQDLTLLGIGDATRTTAAIAMGTASLSTNKPVWRNVWIGNFAIGHQASNMYEAAWTGVVFHGCKQAMTWANACNQNTIVQLTIASCGAAGVNAVQWDNAGTNTIVGLTLQTNTAGTVVKLQNASEQNTILGVYSENPTTGGNSISYAIDIAAGCDRTILRQIHLGDVNDNLRTSAALGIFDLGKYAGGTLTDAGNTNEWHIPRGETDVPLTLGANSVRLGPKQGMNGYAIQTASAAYPVILPQTTITGDETLNDSGLQFHDVGASTDRWLLYRTGSATQLWLRDLVNARMHATFTAGNSNVNAYTSFASNVVVQGILTLASYATASRPTASSAGAGGVYYDTTLHKPGYSDGTNWRDATGTVI